MKATLIAIMLFLSFLPSALALNSFEQHYYTYASSNPSLIYGAGFKSTENNCTLKLGVYSNSNGSISSYSLTSDYFSPISTKIGNSYRTLTGNYTCLLQGIITAGTANTHEEKAIITRVGGDFSSGSIDAETTCYTNSDWINITVGYGQWDSRGYSYNSFFQHSCLNPMTANYFLSSSTFNKCTGINSAYINPANFTTDSCYLQYPQVVWIVPFKTGETGIIHYQYDYPFDLGVQEDYGYYEISNPAGTYVSTHMLGDEADLSLKANTEYAFYIIGTTQSIGSGVFAKTINLNISINVYSPSWSCGAWSDCETGTQIRTCTDPLKKIPARVEYQGCLSEALAYANLGFEQSFAPVPLGGWPLQVCAKTFWPLCYDGVYNITTFELPIDWTVVNPSNYYFMDMTSEAASEGSRSLKMWYWPPGNFPLMNNSCQFSDVGAVPQIYRGVNNNTLFVQYAISFPSSYMTIDFDVKKCNEPVIQYDGWCGKACFQVGGNCTMEPKGNYFFGLVDTSSYTPLTRYYGTATESWKTMHADISDLGIVPGVTYNIVFAVNPQNLYDPISSCVYFDNVTIAIRSAEIPCDETTCLGIDKYSPQNVNGTCYYTVSFNDPDCLSTTAREKALNYQDYCVGVDLYSFNNDIKEWLKSVNSTTCIEELEASSIYEPNPWFSPIQNYLSQYGFGWVVGFTAPLFIAIMIALGISIYSIQQITKFAKIKEYSGIVFLIIFLAIMGGESVLQIIPAWFVLILIVFAGLGVATKLS